MAVVGGVEGKPNQIGIRRSGRNGISGYQRSQTNTKNTHKKYSSASKYFRENISYQHLTQQNILNLKIK